MDVAVGASEAMIRVAVNVGGDHGMIESGVEDDLLSSRGVVDADGTQRLLPRCTPAIPQLLPSRLLGGEVGPRAEACE